MSLDFPVVQFVPATQGPAHRDAVRAFVSSLYQPLTQRRLRAAGLRTADGDAFADSVRFQGIAPTAVIAPPPRATDQQMVDAARVWAAAQRRNRTLMVVDVSGSMADRGGEKIRSAAAAARDAVGYLPDDAQLGLWAFSTDLDGSSPWRELVPLGRLGSPEAPHARRERLRLQTELLPDLTERLGNTALYRTTWAAVRAVRHHYDAKRYNSVVLVTDGADTSSRLTRTELLHRLRAADNPSRPVPVFTIAVGVDADTKTLRSISAATGGAQYTVEASSDIRDVFLDAVTEAGK